MPAKYRWREGRVARSQAVVPCPSAHRPMDVWSPRLVGYGAPVHGR
jgi:hypothetical protein